MIVDPQQFLADRIEALSDPKTYETLLLGRVNPILGLADVASKKMGGEGVAEEFKKGITQEKGDPRSGQYDIVLPPMPF